MNPIKNLYSVPLEQLPVAVIDLETTGLHPHRDAICEIGAVQWKGGQQVGSFSSLANPQRSIPERVIQIHHLTPDILQHAPLIQEVIPAFLQFVGRSVLAGHNAGFDIGFLAPVLRPFGISFYQRPIIDTIHLARKLLPKQKGYSLSKLAAALELPNTQFHRALSDAITTGHLLQRLFKEAKEQGFSTLAELEEAFPSPSIYAETPELSNLEKLLWNAIEHTLSVDMRYCNRDGEVRERTISPQRLEPPYIYAFCHLRQEQRCFRLSRIQSFSLSEPTQTEKINA